MSSISVVTKNNNGVPIQTDLVITIMIKSETKVKGSKHRNIIEIINEIRWEVLISSLGRITILITQTHFKTGREVD
jgi:hypothetical protein